ncbi:monovalent cation/H+ antiporter subunit D family protein [Parvularcula sp. LCG005]|uniref:monovalent cation/H+ antiporter subunit D family protein n=1 Tax=Parvularcula sp. LCG005 TaxID=3078805 RepID=UPI002943F58D|nr:monovalent cation/H+ antiporter subunit D family protein [Parvularcula sp. LCG005]WOI53966.1 monovalent cation/H+ antiporter subunit D family protein [Parvularcula sp. LCG005]
MNISEHLPILAVVVPLLAAPICIMLPKGTLSWAWATIVSWVTFAICLALFDQVYAAEALQYDLGGWSAPFGIVYRIDILGALILCLVSGIAAFVFPYARESIRKELGDEQSNGFYTMLLVCMAGLMGVVATGDAFNVFVFLEVSSLSTYALVAMGARQDRRALTAAFTYLVLGTIGATFFVIGLGLLYQATGTLNMLDLHDRLAGQDNRVVRAGFAFIVTGLGLKLAMFPLHRWLPDAYTYSPSAVTAFLASTATKVAVFAMLRFLFTVFGFTFAFMDVALFLFILLGLAGMFVASLIAVFRDDVKQMLAFSSVAQVGYMLLGISFATVDGVSAAVMHVFNHALMKAALFMAVGAVFYATRSHQISAYRGLGKRMPFTAACFIIAGCSLIGFPFTAGFISKAMLLNAAFSATLPVPSLLIAILILMSSLLAVAYIGRVAWAMFLLDPPPNCAPVPRIPYLMLVPMAAMVLANLYVGVDAEGLATITRRGAETLMSSGLLGTGGAR